MLKNYRLMLLYLEAIHQSRSAAPPKYSLTFQMYFDLYVELDRVDKHDSRLGYGEFEAILPKLLRWGAEITPRYPPRCRRYPPRYRSQPQPPIATHCARSRPLTSDHTACS